MYTLMHVRMIVIYRYDINDNELILTAVNVALLQVVLCSFPTLICGNNRKQCPAILLVYEKLHAPNTNLIRFSSVIRDNVIQNYIQGYSQLFRAIQDTRCFSGCRKHPIPIYLSSRVNESGYSLLHGTHSLWDERPPHRLKSVPPCGVQ